MGPAKEAIAEDNADKEHVLAAIHARFRKAVVIYLIDPEIDPATGLDSGHPKDINRKYLWKGESEIGVVKKPSMKELWVLFAQYVPARRHLREIWGAISTPPADSMLDSQQFLNTTEKVEAFFMLTCSAPIYLMGVLSTLEGLNRRPNTPQADEHTSTL